MSTEIGNLKKSKQLSIALGIVGVSMPPQTAELVLELLDEIKAKGNDVSIGDIQRITDGIIERNQVAQRILKPNP
jgi:hypothetical protein